MFGGAYITQSETSPSKKKATESGQEGILIVMDKAGQR